MFIYYVSVLGDDGKTITRDVKLPLHLSCNYVKKLLINTNKFDEKAVNSLRVTYGGKSK